MSPRGSHLKCRRCGSARHRGVRYPYCGRCYRDVVKPALLQERAQLKADHMATIIDEVLSDTPVLAPVAELLVEDIVELDEVITEIEKKEPASMPRGRRPQLTPEVRSEIAEAYRQKQPPIEICRAYGIGNAVLYRIVHEAGIPLQTRTNGTAPEPEPEQPVLPGTPEPVKFRWNVTYTVVRSDFQQVVAKDYAEAGQLVNLPAGAEIVSVRRVD